MLEKEKLQVSQHTQLELIESRIEKLTNAMLDELVDRDYFLKKKEKYLLQQQRLQEQIYRGISNKDQKQIELLKMFELPTTVAYAYIKANEHEKRSLLKKTSSNFILNGGRLILEPKYPLNMLFINPPVPNGGPLGVTTRRYSPTVESLVNYVIHYNSKHVPKVDWKD